MDALITSTTTSDSFYVSPLALDNGLRILAQDDTNPSKKKWSVATVVDKPPIITGISPNNALAAIWSRGRCAGEQETFDNDRVTEAKRICADCPVRDLCLQYALDHRESGVWGGTTDSERVVMRRAVA